MIPMTQHLGQLPGRARLGACGHRAVRPSHFVAARGRSWQFAACDSAATANDAATMPYVGTTNVGKGLDSIKHPTRHLGTRST
jgi:hypothetical protein